MCLPQSPLGVGWAFRRVSLPPMPDTLVPLKSFGCGVEGGSQPITKSMVAWVETMQYKQNHCRVPECRGPMQTNSARVKVQEGESRVVGKWEEKQRRMTHSTVYIFPRVSLGGVGTPGKGITSYRQSSVSMVKGNLISWKNVVTGKHELVISLHPSLESASHHRIPVTEAPCK